MPKPLPSGTLILDGVIYHYVNGRFTALGIPMLVSVDEDLVVNENHTPIGAIIGGKLMPMQKLDTNTIKFLKNKYGF